MKFRPYLIAFSVVFGAWAAVPLIAAQGDQARLTGRVTDESGAALPGATVMVTSEKSSKPMVVVTDNVGQYKHHRSRRAPTRCRSRCLGSRPGRTRPWCSARARSSCSIGSSDWRSSPRP